MIAWAATNCLPTLPRYLRRCRTHIPPCFYCKDHFPHPPRVLLAGGDMDAIGKSNSFEEVFITATVLFIEWR